MATKIAINGFGRIGRLVFRAWLESGRDDIEVVAINDLADINTNAHLLQYDSTHGRLSEEVKVADDFLVIGDKRVKVLSEREPSYLGWSDMDIDIVAECTGIFTQRDMAQKHIDAGAKKVLISAPAKDEDITIVYGVNSDQLTAEHKIVSNASCTTNCLAPIAHVINETFGLDQGFMTTIHSYTGDQRIVDTMHKDLHRARAAATNMIPTSTGAAKAVGKVLPALDSKLDGVSIRVPTPNVSVVDLTATTIHHVTAEDVNEAFKQAEQGPLKGVLGTYTAPLVSGDFNHDPRSSVVGLNETKAMGDRFIRVMSWYDNEWGFSNRMLDTAILMGKLG